jgi:beta-glucosidase
VTATITNTGKRAGDEVVQLYLRDPAASRARPVRELKGFRKIHLEPGASQEVMFTIGKDQLGFFDETGRWLVEPGRFEVWIAPDAASGTPVAFELK